MPDATAKTCDVLCTGLIVADHVAAPVAQLPPSGGLASTARTELTIGGCAANVAVDLIKLGVSANIVGCVGDDVLGHFIRKELKSAGVGCDDLALSSTTQTSTTLVVNVEGEDRRFIHAPGANVELTGLEITEAMLAGCLAVYVGGIGMNPALSGENVAAMFTMARRMGVKTVLDLVVGDASAMGDMLAPVLPVTDVFLPNTDEAKLITGIETPRQQAEYFQQQGAGLIVVTCGDAGAIILGDGITPSHVPAHRVQQLDATGGGDAFAAGMILGLLEEADINTCLAYAAAMGASCVQSPGATTSTFTRSKLMDFIHDHPLAIDPLSAPR